MKTKLKLSEPVSPASLGASQAEIPIQAPTQNPLIGETPPSPSQVLGERVKRKYTRRKPIEEDKAGASDTPTIDPKIVEESIKTMLGAIDGIIASRVFDACNFVTKDKDYSGKIAESAALTKAELETIGKLSAAVSIKYGIVGQHAELIMLTGVMGGWAMRVWLVTREIKALRVAAVKAGLLQSKETPPITVN